MGPIHLLTPWPGGVAIAVVLLALLVRLLKRRWPSALVLTAAVLLAMAAFSPVWQWAGVDRVAVMVDLSPSTRGADFRDRARLQSTVARLLGSTPVDWIGFAGQNTSLPDQPMLQDIPTDRTVFTPPPGEPVLLFSDGQFKLPIDSSPVYAVIDPQLLKPDDSAVTSLQLQNGVAVASVSHTGPPRQARWSGVLPSGKNANARSPKDVRNQSVSPVARDRSRVDGRTPVASDRANGGDMANSLLPLSARKIGRPIIQTVTLAAKTNGTQPIALSLNSGDRWPENDAMDIQPPPPAHRPRWWIGQRDPGDGWVHFLPSQCPNSLTNWAAPSVVVLDNVSAAALARQQQQSLRQYADDLGGSIILLGGDHAYAAGGWNISNLGAISPLASYPPKPVARWVVLIDASGSMAQPNVAGNGTLFDAECAAARSLLPLLPPADPVRIGAFSRTVQWWINAPAAVARTLPIPPSDAEPNGPTLLKQALHAALQPSTAPTTVLLMTDADTDPVDPSVIASLCAKAHAKLLVLALGHGRALPSLRSAALKTGGNVVEQFDPVRWSADAKNLLRSQLPQYLERSSADVSFIGQFGKIRAVHIVQRNRTWQKQGTEPIARAADQIMGASWHMGLGRVIAVAFSPTIAIIDQLADKLARTTTDPRFTITWNLSGINPQVNITAREGTRFLNRELFMLHITHPESTLGQSTMMVPQVGPGRYELALSPDNQTRLVAITHGSQLLDRRAVAGGYTNEFAHIGINRAKLKQLADRTGGAVIEPGHSLPGPIRFITQSISLALPLLGTAAICIVLALWRWKRGS